MYAKNFKTNTERIINISNIYNIKQNSFNDNFTFIKSMNNSLSSQKLITQNSTCSSCFKPNKTFLNEENIITDIKPIHRNSNENILKNLYVSNFSIKGQSNTSNLKQLVYRKKHVNNFHSIKGINNINTIRNKKEKNIKTINLINDEFSKKINTKEKKEFNDLTLDEYLKEQINKYFNSKTHNNNKENINRNIQSLGNINTHKNETNNKSITNNKKSLLNNYITYNSYINIPNETKAHQNKIKQKFCSKIAYIDLPKPKHTSKNKINSSLNNTRKDFKLKFYKKNDSNTFIHRKVNSFDRNMKNTFKKQRYSLNLKEGKHNKIKIVNLEIDLSELMGACKNNPKKKFKFSKSTKKSKEKININNFTNDFFIVPKLKKF